MQDHDRARDDRRGKDEPPAKAEGPLKGAPVDGATADNPENPKGEPGRDAPRPGAR